MPPRLSLFTARSLACRAKPTLSQPRCAQVVQQRFASEDTSKTQETPKGPNMDQLPHVSEEQAATDKIMGEPQPDVSQGTPVQEVLKRDPEAQKKAPEVMKQQMKNDGNSGTGQKRAYSTSARRPAAELQQHDQAPSAELIHFTNNMADGLSYPDAGLGHKFGLVDPTTLKKTDRLKKRYDDVVDQVTKSLMQHGKLGTAQRNMSIILDTLRTAPPPQANPAFPGRLLLSDSPRQGLPLSPIAYLTAAIDSVAPLLKIRQQRGIAGGGASLPIPVPLGERQRRRTAIQWILASAANRKETRLADRVAREIINVAEGKSSVWEKRALVHKLAVSARSNVKISVFSGRK